MTDKKNNIEPIEPWASAPQKKNKGKLIVQGDKQMGDNFNLNNLNNIGGNIGNNNEIGSSPAEPSLFKKPLFYLGFAGFIYFMAVAWGAYDLQQQGLLGNKTFKEIVLAPILLLKTDDKK